MHGLLELVSFERVVVAGDLALSIALRGRTFINSFTIGVVIDLPSFGCIIKLRAVFNFMS
jgi:hypothetical protein